MSKRKETIQDLKLLYEAFPLALRIKTKGKKPKLVKGTIITAKSGNKHLLVPTGNLKPNMDPVNKSYGPGTRIMAVSSDDFVIHLTS